MQASLSPPGGFNHSQSTDGSRHLQSGVTFVLGGRRCGGIGQWEMILNIRVSPVFASSLTVPRDHSFRRSPNGFRHSGNIGVLFVISTETVAAISVSQSRIERIMQAQLMQILTKIRK